MMLAEAMGVERFKRQVKIYATDVDNDALDVARSATYSAKRLEAIPDELRNRYFNETPNGYVFRNDLRRCLIFGRHDLMSDPPISRLDLLICRNTLIYFNAEAQSRILARFNFGLKQDGILFLGKSEMLLTHARLFAPIDVPNRIFRKVSGPDLRDRLMLSPAAGRRVAQAHAVIPGFSERQLQMREVSFDGASISQILLDRLGNVILANDQARRNLGIADQDIGRPVQDLEISYRPAEIRSKIDEVHATLEPVAVQGVEHRVNGAVKFYDIQIEPLVENEGDLLGVSVSYVDVTVSHRLRLEVERSQHELETAYEEVQATNEELETTNEELQSAIEELETTNEELQSTNEELETMNEELQSTNEELETMNDEMRRRTHDLNVANEFMDVIMSSMRSAVVVTDAEMRVQLWNYRAEDLWGLRATEVEGKQLTGLDIGLRFDEFSKQLEACLQGHEDFADRAVDAINRRGKPVKVRLSCNRLVSRTNSNRGLLVLMEVSDG
jgi:two-component system CheB/CheR fusion protein